MWLGILDGLLHEKCPDWHQGISDREVNGTIHLVLKTHKGEIKNIILTKKEVRSFYKKWKKMLETGII